jgi:DNA-binding PadR family transcriptional regulator
MPALRELEQAGFITTTAGPNPAQPLYSVTPTGQQQLPVPRAEAAPTGPSPDIAEQIAADVTMNVKPHRADDERFLGS